MIANLYVDNRLWKSMEIKDVIPILKLATSKDLEVRDGKMPSVLDKVELHHLIFECIGMDYNRDIVRYKFKGIGH